MFASKAESWFQRSSNGVKTASLASPSSIQSCSTTRTRRRTDRLALSDLVPGLGLWLRDHVARRRLRRDQARATILHLQCGERLGIAAVKVLVVDNAPVVERRRTEVNDVDRHRLHELGLDRLAGSKNLVDLLARPLATIIASEL